MSLMTMSYQHPQLIYEWWGMDMLLIGPLGTDQAKRFLFLIQTQVFLAAFQQLREIGQH